MFTLCQLFVYILSAVCLHYVNCEYFAGLFFLFDKKWSEQSVIRSENHSVIQFCQHQQSMQRSCLFVFFSCVCLQISCLFTLLFFVWFFFSVFWRVLSKWCWFRLYVTNISCLFATKLWFFWRGCWCFLLFFARLL